MYSEAQKQMIIRAAAPIRKILLEYIDDGFSALQIEQILFGIEDRLDVSQYADKNLSIKEMKRKRLILSQTAGLPYNYDSLSHKQLKRGVIFYLGTLSPIAANFFHSMHGYRITQFRIGNVDQVNILRGIENSRLKDKSQTYYFVILKDDLIELPHSEILHCTEEYVVTMVRFPHLTPYEDRKDFIEDIRSKLSAQREKGNDIGLVENLG